MLNAINLAEKGILPDAMVRLGIRRLCAKRLKEYKKLSDTDFKVYLENYVSDLKKEPIAEYVERANEQHYEVPQEFFSHVLGPRLKYSSCYFESPTDSLAKAEEASLMMTCERMGISNGDQILELGCGWGSLSLFMAEKYPQSKIVAISNSHSQRKYIESQIQVRGLNNLTVITQNAAELTDLDLTYGPFDRVVSVEMFEHLKNYAQMMSRIASWLKPNGTLFIHIFTHKEYPYPFETEGQDNWMGKYFFTGGQMPSQKLLTRFQEHLRLEKTWQWNGKHYGRTAECWLENMTKNRGPIIKTLANTYGNSQGHLWFNRWRIFFMSCAELFSFDSGEEWGVTHYLFRKASAR